MDLFDSPYFSLNKKLLTFIGLWPYDRPNRKIVRSLWLFWFAFLDLPHLIGLVTHARDVELIMEHLAVQVFVVGPFFKLLLVTLAEEKMKVLFSGIVQNWSYITDEYEKKLLWAFSDEGRMLTIGYIAFGVISYGLFITPPFIPIVLDILFPLEEPRPYVYILHGDYLVKDTDRYYWFITLWDFALTFPILAIVVSVDTMYSACVKHCLGLFVILKYRLRMTSKSSSRQSAIATEDLSYERMVKIIELHQKILRFTKIIDNSYSLTFLILMIIHLVGLPLVSVIIIIYLNDPINLIRAMVLFSGLTLHQLYINYPAQQLLDYSGGLLIDSYSNEWYESSPRTKKLLKFFALRCTKPCLMTSGGLIEMNMENFFAIMKTAISYITVFASFRAK